MLVSYSSSSEEENEEIEGEKRKRKGFKSVDRNPICKKQKYVTGTGDVKLQDDHAEVENHIHGGELSPARVLSRLPLPDSVLDMFKGSDDLVTEDETRHGGRIRSFQHERGNWATYAYLPYTPEDEVWELLDEMIKVAETRGLSLTRSEEFHISLSQTVVLRHHWIQPFMLSLRAGLAQCRRFVCVAEKVKVYTNQEKSRTFLGVEVSIGQAQLLELVKVLDRTMEDFNLSTFYQNPSFHITLAWCVGDCTDQLRRECLKELQSLLDMHEDGAFQLKVACKEVRCKSGNKVFSYPLC